MQHYVFSRFKPIYLDYHVVSSKEATKKRASGQAEVCRWVMILFIGFFTALVAFGIDEGTVQQRNNRSEIPGNTSRYSS